ncbi:MAG: bifunctional (p)ppGpp synthetase/guanosine-3',5'-bis(diphosphate) 3'-pyrophosphohydrolase, partial [Gammaproteobacteria bacterium]
AIEKRFGREVAHLVDGVERLAMLSRDLGGDLSPAQAENLRKMLLVMAEDVRVVLIKLAERTQLMRTLKHLPEHEQKRVAQETLSIFTPLASRLGIGSLKWELEDLAFRYLEPERYQHIAALLDERRRSRERYIETVVDKLRRSLGKAGIPAQVSGRPKHIYSIWKKMQRKGVDFHQVFDVRAVRVLVESIPQCYAALGIVHSLWTPIPGEFDDYIATPKENLYRSLHTAVHGPEGKTLEVQIRTHEMHHYAELGVAAHWRYKEGGRQDPGFERRIAWLRRLLEQKGDSQELLEAFQTEAFQDRIYVITPKGEVMDLPEGSTPLDFAYHIHTQVGHRCRGAKVNGRIVPLNTPLKSGDQVEILTAREGGPSRDWLSPHLGYLQTSKARARVRQWFKQQDLEKNQAEGRSLLERELKRLGAGDVGHEKLARRLGFERVADLYAALGRGEVTAAQVAGAVQVLQPPAPSGVESLPLSPGPASPSSQVVVEGMGDLLSHVARCCKPLPGDSVIGYITQGRGVAVHRRDCPNVLRLGEKAPARLIEVNWEGRGEGGYAVDIAIEALDRPGLLRDITAVLSDERINVLAVNTHTDRHGQAHMRLTLTIRDLPQLSRVLARISRLPNVMEASRVGA